MSLSNILDREQGLRRTLDARRMSMIAIGGAIGTGLFLGSGLAIGLAGPAVLVSYLVGGVIGLLLMGCLAEMSVAHPTAGSFGVYAQHYLGPLAGFLVRYAYWTANVLAVGTEVTAVALYMQFWFPDAPGWLWMIACSALLITVNARSVAVYGHVEYWFSAVKIAAILLFILLGAYVVLRSPAPLAHYTNNGGFWPKGIWGAWVAVIMAIFSYLSLEMVAVAAGEAAQPQRSIMRAFRFTLVRLVLFYILTLALVLALVPWNAASTTESPFVTVMRTLHLPRAAGVLNLVILVAALSAMNSQLYVATRMMFSLARAGYAPRALGELNARGVPLRPLLLSSAGIAVAAVLNVLTAKSAFIVMVSISAFGSMFAWLMIFVTHYAFRRARARAHAPPLGFRMWGFPLTTLLGATLMVAVLITTLFTPEFRLTLLCGVPVLLVLAVLYGWWYRGAARE
jgi:L-asparagine transporter-like permease